MPLELIQDSNEAKLIRACQNNDRLAQFELFRRYSARFLGIAYRFAGDYDTANDLIQEGFIKIFKYIGNYQFHGSFEGWMRKIIVTTCINYIKKNHKIKFEDTDIANFSGLSEMPSVLEQMDCEDIMEAIAQLPQGFRTIVNLYAIEGYSYPDIAEMLEIKEVTVRTQYFRARQKLQAALLKKNSPHYETRIV